jgi:hypothetical protein
MRRPGVPWEPSPLEHGQLLEEWFTDEIKHTGPSTRKVTGPRRGGRGNAGAAQCAAHASFLPPELMDSGRLGDLAWFIIIAMPIAAIVLFWMVHVLPEKIAHKRHHPQKDAIQTLCLLSLVFGGLLWPIAWLWAYTKPVTLHRHGLRHRQGRRLSSLHMAEKRRRPAQVGEREMPAPARRARRHRRAAQCRSNCCTPGPGSTRPWPPRQRPLRHRRRRGSHADAQGAA